MINFTVGPVQSDASVRGIGGEQVPYFRTPEFSALMLENESWTLELLNAPAGARAVFLTGSGTAAMESSIMHVLTPRDRALIVDAGGFGHRFCEICDLHGIPYAAIRPSFGTAITCDDLEPFDGTGQYSTFIVNIHETSTGVHFDPHLISDFCERNNLLLIIDAISSFLADPLDMTEARADVVISGSQKALACAPGVSLIALSPRALGRIEANPTLSYYLDLKTALANADRGQTPFTPAVQTLRQINARLRSIIRAGGITTEIESIATIATDFREKLAQSGLPFVITSNSLSNAVTPLRPTSARASDIFNTLRTEYGIWVCPSGGQLKDTLLRIGHIGALTTADNDELISALLDMQARGLI